MKCLKVKGTKRGRQLNCFVYSLLRHHPQTWIQWAEWIWVEAPTQRKGVAFRGSGTVARGRGWEGRYLPCLASHRENRDPGPCCRRRAPYESFRVLENLFWDSLLAFTHSKGDVTQRRAETAGWQSFWVLARGLCCLFSLDAQQPRQSWGSAHLPVFGNPLITDYAALTHVAQVVGPVPQAKSPPFLVRAQAWVAVGPGGAQKRGNQWMTSPSLFPPPLSKKKS